MTRRRKVLEGRTKTLFDGPEPGTLIQYFKDDTTSTCAGKHAVFAGKGVLCNTISAILMSRLSVMGIDTHFIRRLNMREQIITQAEPIPLEIVIRNFASGNFAKRFGFEEGILLPRSIIEYRWKNPERNYPLVSEEHITGFGWATVEDMDDIMSLAIRINDYLSGLFLGLGIRLVDMRLQFGRIWEDDYMKIVLIDEISPDNCRLVDLASGKHLDRDLFCMESGSVMEGYQDIAHRLSILPVEIPVEI
ncbi:MAG TPA: phosphoribosylaminoimidazolesuccinocarboxamide synthase [Rhodospirillaceae bacterium]|nr:MAG: phosphoribosylaminoimidazolesuccinocarboxamide synthase [Alphaproteobacteria bacterium GWF2_58_20]HAU28827.1 phosphoribosylaminoimidazolesuccinocarboxamide synthase [Rhodospirillaceae bacterium]